MHYSNDAFSKDDEATLIAKPDHDLKFGQRVQWTCLDVKQINTLYPCHKLEFCDKDFFVPNMTKKDVLQRKRDQVREARDRYRSTF